MSFDKRCLHYQRCDGFVRYYISGREGSGPVFEVLNAQFEKVYAAAQEMGLIRRQTSNLKKEDCIVA